MLIAKLLENKPMSSQELYTALNQKGHKNRNKEGGLGALFKQKTRHALIKEAFTIDDKKKEATLKNVEPLKKLALALKTGDKLHQNDNKYALCLALICYFANPSTHADMIKVSLDELNLLYSENGKLKLHTVLMQKLITAKRKTLEKNVDPQPAKPIPVIEKIGLKAELEPILAPSQTTVIEKPKLPIVENLPAEIKPSEIQQETLIIPALAEKKRTSRKQRGRDSRYFTCYHTGDHCFRHRY